MITDSRSDGWNVEAPMSNVPNPKERRLTVSLRSLMPQSTVRGYLRPLGMGVILALTVALGTSCSGPTASSSVSHLAAVPPSPSSGCAGGANTSASGTHTLSLAADGLTGSYIEHVPPGHSRQPLPVIVDLHGYSEPAALQTQVSDWATFGDTHGVISITPEINRPVELWNTANSSSNTDLEWFGTLMSTVESHLCVDRRRLFVDGYSNGAMMTSLIACRFADQVAAVAPVAGIQAPPGCHPARAVPVIAFHGTADPFVPYQGGIGPKALELPAPDGSGGTLGQSLGPSATKGPSVPQQTTTWAKRNGCAAHPIDHVVASDVTLITYRCPRGHEVELYRVTGGGHAWPGSASTNAMSTIVGRTTFSISADKLMWRFFMSHPLPSGPAT
jgi:polyhydroxybutyrate depolymerase